MLPSEVLKDAGLDVTAILKVSDIFHYLHEQDINGTRIVDDELYQQFMAYRERYG
jgi:orotate phosphoribosyltransferase